MSVLQDERLERLLERLHAANAEQSAAMDGYFAERRKQAEESGVDQAVAEKAYLSDKMVALDRDKAEFCYQLCRAGGARRVVEIGTSYGVSTLYLAAAVRDNQRPGEGCDVVIGTEYEPGKAAAARKTFAEAGLSGFIELREGDLRETLKTLQGPIDFALIDIWTPMARPAIELIAPHLRPGAAVLCDNSEACREDYADYFAFLNDPANGFRTLTLPFDGGLEFSVRL